MLAFRSVVSVLLRALGDFSLHPQGRPCERPPAALRPGSGATVTGAPAPPFGAAGTDAAAWWTRRSRPAWGHIGATPDGSARDNRGQRRPVVAPGQRLYPRSGAGRPDTPILSRTEEARGSNPLTSTPQALVTGLADPFRRAGSVPTLLSGQQTGSKRGQHQPTRCSIPATRRASISRVVRRQRRTASSA